MNSNRNNLIVYALFNIKNKYTLRVNVDFTESSWKCTNPCIRCAGLKSCSVFRSRGRDISEQLQQVWRNGLRLGGCFRTLGQLVLRRLQEQSLLGLWDVNGTVGALQRQYLLSFVQLARRCSSPFLTLELRLAFSSSWGGCPVWVGEGLVFFLLCVYCMWDTGT